MLQGPAETLQDLGGAGKRSNLLSALVAIAARRLADGVLERTGEPGLAPLLAPLHAAILEQVAQEGDLATGNAFEGVHKGAIALPCDGAVDLTL